MIEIELLSTYCRRVLSYSTCKVVVPAVALTSYSMAPLDFRDYDTVSSTVGGQSEQGLFYGIQGWSVVLDWEL